MPQVGRRWLCPAQTQKGDFYLLRIIPYRTIDNIIDGVVITFTNVSRCTCRTKSGV